MRALVQRVRSGKVHVGDACVGAIGRGLVILLGVRTGDTETDVRYVAEKCVNLRIFTDSGGKFNLSALDVEAAILVVSQFTLYGDCRKGRRPSFVQAAPPDVSTPLYELFVSCIVESGLETATGRFGADMLVEIANDGPVTVMVESRTG